MFAQEDHDFEMMEIVLPMDHLVDKSYYEKAEYLNNAYNECTKYGDSVTAIYESCLASYTNDSSNQFDTFRNDFYIIGREYYSSQSFFLANLNTLTSYSSKAENIFFKEFIEYTDFMNAKMTNYRDSIQSWHELLNPSRGMIDSDGDGVPDEVDMEPNTPEGSLVDVKGTNIILDDGKNSILTSFSSIQGDMINALSSFIADRFRQESLNLALTSMFKTMTKEDSVMVSRLFPRTFVYINTLLGDGTYYSADLLQLRQIVYMDVHHLNQSFETYKEDIFLSFSEYPVENEVFKAANYILGLNGSYTNYDLLQKLPNKFESSELGFANWLNFVNEISEVVETRGLEPQTQANLKAYSNEKWIDVNALVNPNKIDENKVKFFYGLYYYKLQQFQNWKEHLSQYYSLERRAREMYLLIEPFQNETLDFKFGLNDSAAIENTLQSANSSFNFLRKLCAHPVVQDSFDVNPAMFEMANHTIDLTRAFRNKKYPEAINIMSLYFVKYLGGHLKNLHSVSFLLEFYKVRNARDMQYLIESYAMPIGSSSVKRNSKFNVAVNSYAGLTGGYELAYGELQTQTKANIGLTAPIGISTTFANGHLTAFGSILDLGSIVNQRLNNDTISYSGLKFEQFFTPGAGLFYNFKSTPLTIGAVYNYIPNLRTITYQSGNAIVTETHRSVSRINFSVLIDIPLFNIYNRK
jgi:hypothetical protein